MGAAGKPLQTKLFLAIMFQPQVNIQDVVDMLQKTFGPVECSYGPIAFT